MSRYYYRSGTALWQKCFKMCTELCALEQSSPVAQMDLSPQGFKLQLKNKQTTYLLNLTLKAGAFSQFPDEAPDARFTIGLKNVMKLFALFGKELSACLQTVGPTITALTFEAQTMSGDPIRFCAQVLQTKVTRVKITKDFEVVARDIDAKKFSNYLLALDGSGTVILSYDDQTVNLQASSKTDSTSCTIGSQLKTRSQLRIPVSKPLKMVLEFLGSQTFVLLHASNVLKLVADNESFLLQLLLSIS